MRYYLLYDIGTGRTTRVAIQDGNWQLFLTRDLLGIEASYKNALQAEGTAGQRDGGR